MPRRRRSEQLHVCQPFEERACRGEFASDWPVAVLVNVPISTGAVARDREPLAEVLGVLVLGHDLDRPGLVRITVQIMLSDPRQPRRERPRIFEPRQRFQACAMPARAHCSRWLLASCFGSHFTAPPRPRLCYGAARVSGQDTSETPRYRRQPNISAIGSVSAPKAVRGMDWGACNRKLDPSR